MFVSVRYNELEAGRHLYHCGQSLQQQQQQQQRFTATDWTLHTPSYTQHQRFPYSAPMSTSTYLDYCNAVLPACSWYQLSNNTTRTLHGHGSWNLQTSRSSAASALWTSSVNSTCYDNNRPCVYDYYGLSGVHHVADTSVNWYTNDYLMSSRSQTASSCQHQTPVCEPVSTSAQHSAVDQGPSSHAGSELSSRPTQSTDARHRQLRRNKEALVPLIIRAILSAAETRLSLADICRYIEQHSVDYAKSDDQTRWHNNVRHTLSHYEFFVKCGRVPTGRGNYWTVHPVCRAAFAADDFRIKRARHAVQMHQKSLNVTSVRRGTYSDALH